MLLRRHHSFAREALPAGTIIYVVGLFGNPYSVGMTFIVGQDAGPNSYPALNCVQDLPIAFTTSTTGAPAVIVGEGHRFQYIYGFNQTPPQGTKLVVTELVRTCASDGFVLSTVVQ